MTQGVDLRALEHWLIDVGLGEGPITDITPLTGGTQNILLRFRQDDRLFVLRRPPVHLRSNSNETMRREARVLAAIADTGVPHPRLIAACSDETVLGAAFYLMQPVDGFNASEGLPSPHRNSSEMRRRMGLALAEGIAALAALDYQALGLGDLGRPENYLERQVARWKSQLESYGDQSGWPGAGSIPGVEVVGSWLEAHRPKASAPGIIHGDYHLANVMYRRDSGELAAIVDWELTTVGDPLIDLGWLMATWPTDDVSPAEAPVTPWEGFPTIDELVAHYGRHSDRDLSSIHWYGVLACYKLGIILEGTYARACAGRAPPETGTRLHAQTLNLFHRAQRWIG